MQAAYTFATITAPFLPNMPVAGAYVGCRKADRRMLTYVEVVAILSQ